MCNVQMIRHERGLVSIPVQKAVYCENCERVSNSAWPRCGLCGSESIVDLLSLLGGSSDPDPTPPPSLLALLREVA
jgi:hypothetical protein